MKLKDKIKTVAIGMVTAVMTSCGFKSNKAEVVERHPSVHAFNDSSRHRMSDYRPLGWMSISGIPLENDDSIDVKKRHEWQEKLDNAGIPVAKKGENDTDSLLVSVEEKDGKLQNPRYGLNPSAEVQAVERVDGYNIERDGKTQKVNKFDKSFFGVENVKEVKKRVTETIAVVKNKDVVKTLKKGDKINGHVVEEDGKSPTIQKERDEPTGTEVTTFNYTRNYNYKE